MTVIARPGVRAMIRHMAVFCFCVLLAFPARAAEEKYIPATFPDLLHSLVKFNALNVMEDNNLLDEYAAITDCDLYLYYYKDDFKWNQIRTLIRRSITQDLPKYPTRFYFKARFKLDRYDFADELYRFSRRTQINALNVIELWEFTGPVCGDVYAFYLPLVYKAKLDPAVTIPGLRIDPKSAEAMQNFMDANGNSGREVYGRFNLSVIYIEPLRRTAADPGAIHREYSYYQARNPRHTLIIDVRVDSVDFYEDIEMTKMVYSFKPSSGQ
jgi:hypothetical protein